MPNIPIAKQYKFSEEAVVAIFVLVIRLSCIQSRTNKSKQKAATKRTVRDTVNPQSEAEGRSRPLAIRLWDLEVNPVEDGTLSTEFQHGEPRISTINHTVNERVIINPARATIPPSFEVILPPIFTLVHLTNNENGREDKQGYGDNQESTLNRFEALGHTDSREGSQNR